MAGWVSPGVEQPIAFPHKTHIALKVPCTGCHQQAEKGSAAGRPPTALCAACHAASDTKDPEIAKLKAYAEKGEEIPWRRVWRLPSHVFFPHRIHVAIAKISCQTCHGPMENLDRPPPRPLKILTMSDCIACHTERKLATDRAAGAKLSKVRAQQLSSDCIVCHR
ncbi:MAG TPA: cytochrome c3 family protein [candidate division Zixibacteria bacterium]|nr:cytochrome c3 family protein [candidate division Zixibacteria bacterium]